MADARILPCLEELIGVADSDCPCFSEGQSGSVIAPKANLFLSQLVDINTMMAGSDCNDQVFYDIGQQAINEGTLRAQNNLLQCFGTQNIARKQWRGLVGQRDCTRSQSVNDALAGLMFHPEVNIPDGELVITGVGTMFNTTGTDLITVSIYDQVTDTVLHTFTLDATANKFEPNTLATPIVLPFRLADLGAAKYWMLYEVPDGVRPMDGEIDCGCSSGIRRLFDWMSIYGTQGDLLTERGDWNKTDRHYGLLPEITVRCKVENSICPEEELDFASNQWAGILAEAIWYISASIFLDKIRKSGRINRATLQPDDQLKSFRNEYNAEFRARMDNLCRNMPPGSCYTCEPGMDQVTIDF